MGFQLLRYKPLQWLLLLLTALTLSACGFHMRGTVDLPFKTVLITGIGKNTPLGVDLTRNLHLSGAEVVEKVADADAILQILSDTHEKKIEALDTSGNVRDYALYDRVRFVLKDKSDAIIVGPITVVLKRDITYDPNQELAKQTEEVLLYREMQRDLVQQIMRRLGAIKPQTGDDTTTEP